MPSSVTIVIAGNDRTQVVPFRLSAQDTTSQIHIENITPGTATAHLVIWDSTNSVTFNDNDGIVITDSSTPGHNLFQGYVQKRSLRIFATYRVWEVSCVDLNSWLDLIIVGAPDGSNFLQDPPGTYTAIDPNAISQKNDQATVQWLFSHYASFLPIDTTTFVEELQPSLTSQVLRWSTVTMRQALDELAGLVNSAIRFWIDADWAFHWTIRPTPGTAGQGPLRRMFPIGKVLPAAPRLLTDGPANHTTTLNYEDFMIEYDDSQWADSVYVVGSTGYTFDAHKKALLIGGSGWVGDSGPIGRQRILNAQNSDTISVRDSVGGTALEFDSKVVTRGACAVVCDFGGWFPGQAIGITAALADPPLSNSQYMIQKVSTDFLSGLGDRHVALEWGDAPIGTIGLRRQAQAHSAFRNRPRRPSAKLVITVSNSSPGRAGTVRVYAQVADPAGVPWPVAGGVTTWSVQVFNVSCTDVSAGTAYTLSATTSTTNANGLAWVDFTTDPNAQDVTYYVSGSCVIGAGPRPSSLFGTSQAIVVGLGTIGRCGPSGVGTGCGITDSFNRVDGVPGTADCGYAWSTSGSGAPLMTISTDQLYYSGGNSGGAGSSLVKLKTAAGGLATLPFSTSGTSTVGSIQVTSYGLIDPNYFQISWVTVMPSGVNGSITFDYNKVFGGTGFTIDIIANDGSHTAQLVGAAWTPPALPYTIQFGVDSTHAWTIVGGTTFQALFSSVSPPVYFGQQLDAVDWQIAVGQIGAPNGVLSLDTLDITGLNLCTVGANIVNAPPGTAPVPPPKPGVVYSFPSGGSQSSFESKCLDMTIDVIELPGGTYLWDNVNLQMDRTARPLTVRAAAGAFVHFLGSGLPTTDGVIKLGTNFVAKYITIQGITFDGYKLSACGVFEVRSTDHVTLTNCAFVNLTRDAAYADQAYKSWCAYISAGTTANPSGSNTNLTIDSWTIAGGGRTVHSGIQIDNGVSAANVTITNVTISACDYAFYENVTQTGLTLGGWDITDCGQGGASVAFHKASGTYGNMTGHSADPIAVNASSMVSTGGIIGL